MYGSIEHYEQANATDDDLIRAGRQLATDLGRLRGFVAYVLLTGADGHLLALSLFEDEAGLRAATSLPGLNHRLSPGGSLQSPGQPCVTCGEVLVQKGL